MTEPRRGRNTSLGGSVGFLGGTNAVAFAAGIVRQKVFAVFLGSGGYGAYALAAALFELLQNLVRLGADHGLIREMSRRLGESDRAGAARTFLGLRRLLVLLSLVPLVPAVLFAGAISRELFGGALPPWSVPVVALGVPAAILASLAEGAMNAVGKIRRLATSKVTVILVGLGVTVLLVSWQGLEGALIQLPLVAVVGGVTAHLFLRSVFRPGQLAGSAGGAGEGGALSGRALRAVFAVGLATALVHAGVSLNQLVFRAVIVQRLGTADNGIYQAVMGLSRQYLSAVMSGMAVYLFPRLSGLTERRPLFEADLERGARFLLALLVPAAVLLLAARDWIVAVVFTAEFRPMIPLMALSLTGDVARGGVHLLRMALLALGRSGAFVALGLGGELLYLVLFFAGLGWAGLQGAVFAYLLASVILLPAYGALLARQGITVVTPRLKRQVSLALLWLMAGALLPVGAIGSRVVALGLAAAWVLLWKTDLQEGFS